MKRFIWVYGSGSGSVRHPGSTTCFKLNLSLYLLRYAEACNEFVGPSPHYSARATQLFSKKCRSGDEVGNTVSDLTDPRFEPLTSALEMNELPIDQLAGFNNVFKPQNSTDCLETIPSNCYFLAVNTAIAVLQYKIVRGFEMCFLLADVSLLL